MVLFVTKDTFSPRLHEINNQLDGVSQKALEDVHQQWKKDTYPTVPISDNDDTGHAGLLLSSMDRIDYLSFGTVTSVRFGFYASEPKTGQNYALLQEENPYGWQKHPRYAGHRPKDRFFHMSYVVMNSFTFRHTLHNRFKNLLR